MGHPSLAMRLLTSYSDNEITKYDSAILLPTNDRQRVSVYLKNWFNNIGREKQGKGVVRSRGGGKASSPTAFLNR